ncbi:uncharacterized protein TM35_000052720 [Trypanosoma theileri]|uniref:Uncharacterized protein n=1 Tax=Trypanosoma theileri TaxID=67003 RepID=A0A1X0P417_9TRYP|nr:uncharacterized protein TM35_000052720 [Trypanosoma theileri]ORC91676.1 hypothetical protein TM35_000052720 [Trypanosoma theileri]
MGAGPRGFRGFVGLSSMRQRGSGLGRKGSGNPQRPQRRKKKTPAPTERGTGLKKYVFKCFCRQSDRKLKMSSLQKHESNLYLYCISHNRTGATRVAPNVCHRPKGCCAAYMPRARNRTLGVLMLP